MIKTLLARLLIVAFLVLGALPASAADAPQQFDTEQAAQQHCPADTVVWLNLKSGVYHMQGERWYGNTKNGAYVCKAEADQVGDRETGNGE